MLRPLYRGVLCLHPPAFRTRFAEEMQSIFDHTTGTPAALRLLLDGLISLARQWALRQEFWHDLSPAHAHPPADRILSFYTIDPFRPRAAAVIHGLVLSTAVFGLTCFAIRYSWIHMLHLRIPEVQWDSPRPMPSSIGTAANAMMENLPVPPRTAGRTEITSSALPGLNRRSHPAPAPTIQNRIAHFSAPVGPATLASAKLASGTPGSNSPAKSQQTSGLSREVSSTTPVSQFPSQSYGKKHADRPQIRQPNSQDATSPSAVATAPAAVGDLKLDAAERHRVIDGAIANLKEYYVDPEVAQKMADALRAHENSGDDDAATDGAAFADLLTRHMRDVSHDRHLMVAYNQLKTTERPAGPTLKDLARYRKSMERTNCTFEKIEILPRNIGYLKFNEFPAPSVCRPMVVAAMNRLGHADAIIFDLRDNHGGSPDMVALVATYLFDHPTRLNDMYNRKENTTRQSWTLPPVPGNKLADKPAYVLTSARTFSGAEEFSYDLKMQSRATLVGETTGGGAHMVSRHRIDDHFTIGVPFARPINPISKTDWEGTGVVPDVKVKAVDALTTAEKLAESKLQKK